MKKFRHKRLSTPQKTSARQKGSKPPQKAIRWLFVRTSLFCFLSQVVVLYVIYLPFHILFSWELLPFFLQSNIDHLAVWAGSQLLLWLMFLRFQKKIQPLLTQDKEQGLSLEDDDRHRYHRIIMRFTDLCSVYVGLLIPVLLLINSGLKSWLSDNLQVVKFGGLIIALFAGLFVTLMTREFLLRRLNFLRLALRIYLTGDGSNRKRAPSSATHLAVGMVAISLVTLMFKYGIDVFHDFQASIIGEFYQGIKFDTTPQLIRLLMQEKLAAIVNYLPTNIEFVDAISASMLERVLAMSLLQKAAHLFSAYIVLVVVISLAVWYALAGSEKVLHFIFRCVSGILRRERSLSAKIELLEMNEIGYLTGYFNLLLDRVSKIGDQVFQRAAGLHQLLQELQKISQRSQRLLTGLNDGVSKIEEHSQQQLGSNQRIHLSLERILTNVGNIDVNLANQRQMVDDISKQVNLFATAANRVDLLAAAAQAETQRLVSMVRTGEQAVKNLIHAMHGISESSGTIEKIILGITRIAAQTSMLSMNAAIEAAHAGDYGSGFAVVAQEVRTLSEEATLQSQNIREEIQHMLGEIDGGLELSQTISSTLEKINTYIADTYNSVSLISQAMVNQSRAAKKIVWSVESVVISSEKIQSWTQKQDEKSKEIQQAIARLGVLSQTIQEDTVEMRQDIGALENSNAALDQLLVNGQNQLRRVTTKANEIFKREQEAAL